MLSNVSDPETHSKISVSELGTLLRCTKRHDYAYRQGLQPVRTPSYFSKGKLLHEAMAEWLSTIGEGVTPGQSWAKAIGNLDEFPPEADMEQVHDQFLDFVRNADMSHVRVEHVEEEFYVDLGWTEAGQPVLLHGVIDALVRDVDTGETWVVEHKTAGRAWSESQFTFDFQAPLYMEALEALTGQRPVGLTYQFFYPKRWEQKQRFIGPEESRGVVGEVQSALKLRELSIITRQPHWGCNDCTFKQLCSTEMFGGDSSHLRENLFTVDEAKAARFALEVVE